MVNSEWCGKVLNRSDGKWSRPHSVTATATATVFVHVAVPAPVPELAPVPEAAVGSTILVQPQPDWRESRAPE